MNGFHISKIKNAVMLAPMAGVADAAFRILCRELCKAGSGNSGCGGGDVIMFTEMVSAKGLCYGDAKSYELARFSDVEKPIGIQIFGSEPSIIAQAVELLSVYHPDLIDINMGCPMPKITKNGEGAALMLEPVRAEAIVRAAVGAAARAASRTVGSIPVSVKIRKGWDNEHINAVEFARRMEDAGAAMITVHGRTREQLYGGSADWQIIADIKQAVGIPVTGNGDVCCTDDAIRMLSETGCDCVMIGRAMRGKPWLLRDAAEAVSRWYDHGGAVSPWSKNGEAVSRWGINGGAVSRWGNNGDSVSNELSYIAQVDSHPSFASRSDIIKRHLDLAIQHKGERIGMLEMRKHLAWYIKGIKGAATLRNELFQSADYKAISHCIECIESAQ